MTTFAAGVAGPIPLEDGRVVTAEQGPFELDVATPHDEDLVERGVIVAVENEQTEQEQKPPASQPAQKPATPAAGADTTAGSGEKEE